MNTWIGRVILCAGMVLFSLLAHAGDEPGKAGVPTEGLTEGYVNVREYIAKVGNPNNHTEAIRLAFQNRNKGGAWYGVFFPPGNYTIDDAIEIDYAKVVGNNATITQTNPGKDIFVATHFMASVEGITFSGGHDQIHVDTGGNCAAGQLWSIRDCNFRDANGRAIYLNGNCTYAIIEHGLINGCKGGILYAALDGVTMRDFHGGTDNQTNAAAFDVRLGFFIMEDCLWTPTQTHPDARWIDNRSGMLFVHHTHFGGESGGFTPVVNYQKLGGSVVHLDSCCFYAQSNLGKKTVIYCEEIPEVIHIQDCQIGGIEPIMLNPKIDLKNYFVQVNQPLRPSYRIEDCAGYVGDLPEGLRRPAVLKAETNFLDDAKTRELMAEAAKSVAAMTAAPGEAAKPETCVEMISHAQRTEPMDPAKYVKASFSNCVVEDVADGEVTPNANYFAVQSVGDNLIIMKRQFQTGNAWVSLKGFTVDADKYPILTRKVKSAGSYRVKTEYPPLRVIDRATGKMTQLGGDNKYLAMDLRKVFGGGAHTLDFRLYWSASVGLWLGLDPQATIAKVGKEYYDAVAKECPEGNLPPGSYLVYDYIRAEAE